MATPSSHLSGAWAGDADDLIVGSSSSSGNTTNGKEYASAPSRRRFAEYNSEAPSGSNAETTPYGVTVQQLESLSAMAYLVGSPLQRQQPSGGNTTHPSLLVAAKLLQQGVDPERVNQLIECRHNLPA